MLLVSRFEQQRGMDEIKQMEAMTCERMEALNVRERGVEREESRLEVERLQIEEDRKNLKSAEDKVQRMQQIMNEKTEVTRHLDDSVWISGITGFSVVD